MMYGIQTDLPPGLIGIWADEDRCEAYATKLRAAGYRATVVPVDTPRPFLEKRPTAPTRRTRRITSRPV